MEGWLQHLKPADHEIRALALLETDPRHWGKFAPIARGSVFAVLAVAAVVLLSLPFCLFRLGRGLFLSRRRTLNEPGGIGLL
jgi:hypothetical protein